MNVIKPFKVLIELRLAKPHDFYIWRNEYMNKEGDFSISYSELIEAKSKKGVLVWNLLVTRDKTIQTGFFKKG